MAGYTEALESARRILGSYATIGRICGGLSGESVRKWAERGRPPRTEYSGETDYASAISRATRGEVPRQDLRPKRQPKGWKKAA